LIDLWRHAESLKDTCHTVLFDNVWRRAVIILKDKLQTNSQDDIASLLELPEVNHQLISWT